MQTMYSHQVEDLSLYQILVNECKVYGSAAAVASELSALRKAEQAHRVETARYPTAKTLCSMTTQASPRLWYAFLP